MEREHMGSFFWYGRELMLVSLKFQSPQRLNGWTVPRWQRISSSYHSI
jgi:ABC-type uncharacterized transport system permease subunit